MKELRSLVNATLLFAVFLLAYALVVPGHAKGSGRTPRFFRMEIEDSGHAGRPEKVVISVPFFLYKGGLHLASAGRFKREMDLHFDEPVAADVLREVWAELSEKPEGTPVTRTDGPNVFELEKHGSEVVIRLREDKEERFTLRIPSRFLEALVRGQRDLDVRALIDEMKKATRGDVVDLRAGDAHVHVSLE